MRLSEARDKWTKTKNKDFEYKPVTTSYANTTKSYVVRKTRDNTEWPDSKSMAALLPMGNSYLGGTYGGYRKPDKKTKEVGFTVNID